MNHRLLGKIASIAFIVFLIGAIGTFAIGGIKAFSNKTSGEIETGSETVKLDGAKSAEVELDLGVGSTTITGGAKDLMEAEFAYDKDYGPPKIEYKVRHNVGELEVSQESKKHFGFFSFDIGDFKLDGEDYRWDIQLNDQIPIDLDVDLGVSSSTLDLSTVNLTSLSLDGGVGDSVIDLSGDRKNSFDVSMDSGVGSIKIILPEDVGVKVKIDEGVGDINADGFRMEHSNYVNDQYGKSDITIYVDIDMGVGDIDLELK